MNLTEAVVTTKVTNLSGEALETLKHMAEDIFLDGECYAYAIALKRGLGWPMFALMEDEVPRHVFVQDDDGSYWDIRGPFRKNDSELGAPFAHRLPYTLKPVKEEDLRSVRPVHETVIRRARQMAEIVWPDLPWKNGYRKRVIAFLDELEVLCRKHELWIRAPLPNPATWPHISPQGGGENGYTLYPTEDGMGYVFERRLGFEEH